MVSGAARLGKGLLPVSAWRSWVFAWHCMKKIQTTSQSPSLPAVTAHRIWIGKKKKWKRHTILVYRIFKRNITVSRFKGSFPIWLTELNWLGKVLDPSLDLFPNLTFSFHLQFILPHFIPPRLNSSSQFYPLSCSPHLNSLPLYPTLGKVLDSWSGCVLDLTLRSSPSPASQLISPYFTSPHLSSLPPSFPLLPPFSAPAAPPHASCFILLQDTLHPRSFIIPH